jgi:site-specific DNA-methyltransferase (adenine-specific)
MPSDFVDLVVTSPPYDNLRTYEGYSFDFEETAKSLFEVVKPGGVVVWVVNDATIKGDETGTSFRQALFFKDIGFRLHDTMIWTKEGGGAHGSNRCYWQNFEYMFVFGKGRVSTVNRIKDVVNKTYGMVRKDVGRRRKDGTRKNESAPNTPRYGYRNNHWAIPTAKGYGDHPAIFPEQLAKDHILSWSNPGDLVYDPFMGSGTTAKMALLTGRNYIGSEMGAGYCDIIKERVTKTLKEMF